MKRSPLPNLLWMFLPPICVLVLGVLLEQITPTSQNSLQERFWARTEEQVIQTGNLDLEKAASTQAATADAPSPEGWLRLGDSYQAQGSLEKALQAWTNAGETLPALERRLQAHLSLQAYDAAATDIEALLTLQPGDASRLKLLGLLQAATQPEGSHAALADAITASTEGAASLQALQDRIQAAVPSAQPAYIYIEAGRGLADMQEWALAAEAFQRAVALRPDYAEAWAFLGEALQHLNIPPGEEYSSDGLAALETAQRLDPGSVSAGLFTALYWRRQGQLTRALELLTALAENNPQNAAIQIELGNLLVEKGDSKTALPYFMRATELAPEDARAWLALANFSISSQFQLRQVGLPAARQLVLLRPEDPTALDMCGQALILLDDPFNAERFLQRAVQADSRYVPARLHLAQVYLERGDWGTARQELSWILSQAPGSPEAEFAQRLIQSHFP